MQLSVDDYVTEIYERDKPEKYRINALGISQGISKL